MVDPTRFTLDQEPAYKNAGADTIGGDIDLTSMTLQKMQERPSVLVGIIIHEIGHQLNINRGYLSLRSDWLTLGHWPEIYSIRAKKPSDTSFNELTREVYEEIPVFQKVGIVSKCAMANADEDFAESIAAYILIPEEFKRISPEKFAYIGKKVFSPRN